MKRLVTFATFVLSISFACADDNITEIPLEQVRQALGKSHDSHPRLFLNDRQLPEVMKKIETSEDLSVLHKAIIKQADNIIEEEPLKRIKKGIRLLSLSGEAIRRILDLSWAYRTSGDVRYLKRAEQEMLAIAEFSDWNPSHFLDVAGGTTAMAIGYDWLYHGLSDESRVIIRKAIIEKGLRPSLYENEEPGTWISRKNNWNQVCHGGMVCGALAIAEEAPELGETIIHRAVNKVQIAMAEYEPDGAYPEGPGYWAYGTTYNVLLLDALDSVLGTDFGLSEKSGFAKSAAYYLHATGPTGLYFNYPDCGSRKKLTPAVFWFVEKYNNPELAWNEQQLWKNAIRGETEDLTSDRMAALALIWASQKTTQPKALSWMGQGLNPVAMFRTSWDNDAVYLGIKGGTPRSDHAHMDIGSFVIDADGLRWAMDLGKESYHKIESLGMEQWDTTQASDRWKLFRYNNFSHNTLTVNGQLQYADGSAPIIRYSDNRQFPHAVIDMTGVYEGQLKKAVRGASLLPSGQVLIQDELCAADQAATVRWNMVTPAKVDLRSHKSAILRQTQKSMQFQVLTEADIKLTTYSTEPRAHYDAENDGTRMIGFDIELAANQAMTIRVVMTPGTEEKPFDHDVRNAETWSALLTVRKQLKQNK